MIIKNILITGAFGFVGNNISQFLKKQSDYRLIALDVKSPDKHSYDIFYNWEQLDDINWDEIYAVVHLAGKAHDTKGGSEQEYDSINLVLTEKIFQYFIKSRSEKLIYFSSVKAVADTVDGAFLSEETIPNPQTPYGKSKLKAENFLLSQNYIKDKKLYILRPCMIHGPGNKGNLNLLYKLVQKGIPYPLGAFENLRSFTSISNLNYVLEQLILKDIAQGVYQMADDVPISTNTLIKQIALSLGKKEKILYINSGLIKKIASIGDLLHLPINNERLKKLTESYVVSNHKIKDAIGVKSMPVSTLEGLEITLKSFKI